MKHCRILIAITMLVLATLACQAVIGMVFDGDASRDAVVIQSVDRGTAAGRSPSVSKMFDLVTILSSHCLPGNGFLLYS